MTDTTMPAAEAAVADTPDVESNSYELAFHVLPTVAEGEVAQVFADLKQLVTDHAGAIFDEEAPERFDLAYEIIQQIEGKNRSFSSAYFGWVRFTAPADVVNDITAEVDARADILRYMLIKLTRVEEAQPFRFHEALASEKMVETIDVAAPVEAETPAESNPEEAKEVDAETPKAEAVEAEKDLDKALEKKEA